MDSSALILGFVGPVGSGCSFVASGLSEQYENFEYFKVSDILRDELKKKGNTKPSIADLQNKGNELRRKNNEGYLVEALIKNISENEKYKTTNEIIIDGIKNVGEVRYLRFYSNFYLFSIHADKYIRRERSVGKIVETGDEFDEIDKRDELENEPYGQQVKDCDYLSDIIVLNNEDIRDYPQSPKRDFLTRIYNNYIMRMLELRKKDPSPEFRPSVDELSMTSAYVLSKMSSCLKRKVGAVVIDSRGGIKNQQPNNGQEILSIPYIVSSGFNEVPLGSKPCMFEYGLCYRDHVQQKHTEKMHNCPNCGEPFTVQVKCYGCDNEYDYFIRMCQECHRELSPETICKKCGCNIFKEYLPGAKMAPGKLLDICRALHAEENALLALVNMSGNTASTFTLYTTTQPCNLCANKIVASGIKKIVFSEPYISKSSEEILSKGGVQTKRFEGVKSSAFFKLYQ